MNLSIEVRIGKEYFTKNRSNLEEFTNTGVDCESVIFIWKNLVLGVRLFEGYFKFDLDLLLILLK